jgi:CelD/BcsL family acetyltransferase involved in cellulose biosynthesis
VIARPTIRSPFVTIQPGEDVSQRGPAKQIRRAKRNLEKHGGYTYGRSIAAADRTGVLRFIDLEAAGWKGEAGTAMQHDPGAVAFYTGLWTADQQSFVPVLHELRTDEGPLAYDIGFEMGECYFGTKGTYDENWKSAGPGHLSMHEILNRMPEQGLGTFDLLGTDEPYKMQWTSDVRQHFHFLVFRKGFVGRNAAAIVKEALPHLQSWRTAGGLPGMVKSLKQRMSHQEKKTNQ